jgi:hypothetical protein
VAPTGTGEGVAVTLEIIGFTLLTVTDVKPVLVPHLAGTGKQFFPALPLVTASAQKLPLVQNQLRVYD